MKILITGICGFVGSCLAKRLVEASQIEQIVGVDNLCRDGSRVNLVPLRELGVDVRVGDIRDSDMLADLPPADFVIDAAAQPSVLAGVDEKTSSLELVQHNLYGTINILEYCKRVNAGFILLSTSRVYSIPPLAGIEVKVEGESGRARFTPQDSANDLVGFSSSGISENFSTQAPVSLYGATKVASEQMALEYGAAFGFPVWINRCGVMAGAGQFGHPQQGIFSFWLHSWFHKRPLKYIGFGGSGFQVRDCLHPDDLVPVLLQQMTEDRVDVPRIANFSGGVEHSMSLAELSTWCEQRWGPHLVEQAQESRPFDLPWIVLDSTLAIENWKFKIAKTLPEILDEIAGFAENHPEWLELSLGKYNP